MYIRKTLQDTGIIGAGEDDTEVKSVGCSCRGPGCDSQYPYGSSQLFLTSGSSRGLDSLLRPLLVLAMHIPLKNNF